jgi:hypothetical protein
VKADSEQSLLLWTPGVMELAINGQRHFGADFFSFRKAPLVLRLKPGRHLIELRLVRDVRAMGGIGAPTIDVEIEAAVPKLELDVRDASTIVSDVIDGGLASPYGTVSVTNTGTRWIQLVNITSQSVSFIGRYIEDVLTSQGSSLSSIGFQGQINHSPWTDSTGRFSAFAGGKGCLGT